MQESRSGSVGETAASFVFRNLPPLARQLHLHRGRERVPQAHPPRPTAWTSTEACSLLLTLFPYNVHNVHDVHLGSRERPPVGVLLSGPPSQVAQQPEELNSNEFNFFSCVHGLDGFQSAILPASDLDSPLSPGTDGNFRAESHVTGRAGGRSHVS